MNLASNTESEDGDGKIRRHSIVDSGSGERVLTSWIVEIALAGGG